jgi:hypothetical protein
MNAFGGNGDGNKTATAGTVINYLIPPNVRGFARLTTLAYKDAGTAHTLTILRPLAKTATVGSAAAAQANIVLASNPGTSFPTADAIAGGDWLAITETDGVTRVYQVSSVTSLTQVTLSSNLVAGTVNNSPVWWFGVAGDVDQLHTGSTHPQWNSNANSSLFTLTESNSGIVAGLTKGDPLLFQSNNITAAGNLQQIAWSYTLSGP